MSQIYNSAKYFPGSSSLLQRFKTVPCDHRAFPFLQKVCPAIPLLWWILIPPSNHLTCLDRYRIRGVRNIIFYGAPEHGQFYEEFLTFPFLDEGVEPSDVTAKLLYSKYDMMRLERIVGTDAVDGLIR